MGLDKRKFDLAALMTYEVGKSRFEALAEVYEVMDFFSYGFTIGHRSPWRAGHHPSGCAIWS